MTSAKTSKDVRPPIPPLPPPAALAAAIVEGHHFGHFPAWCLRDLGKGPEARAEAACRLMAREWVPVTRRVYRPRVANAQVQLRPGAFLPKLHTPYLAAALARQEQFRLGPGRVLARYACLQGDRPLTIEAFGWDGPAPRRVAGVLLEPMPERVAAMALPAQFLTLGLGRHWPRSEPAARDLGRRLGATQIWYTIREIAGPVSNGTEELSALGALILETVARTLPPIGEHLHQTTRRQAPPHWRPPANVGAYSRVEEWWLAEMVFAGGSFECLRGRVFGHPYIAPTDLLRSSPLVWIDVGLGWAQAESRLYRLGRPAADRRSSG